jgi:hypothetical protein
MLFCKKKLCKEKASLLLCALIRGLLQKEASLLFCVLIPDRLREEAVQRESFGQMVYPNP